MKMPIKRNVELSQSTVLQRSRESFLMREKEKGKKEKKTHPISVERFAGILFKTPTIPAILSFLIPFPPSESKSSSSSCS